MVHVLDRDTKDRTAALQVINSMDYPPTRWP